MNACAGRLARRVQTLQTRPSVQIRPDAAHQVMRRGANGNEVARQVQTVLSQERADSGKSLV
jgi:hypothetical protein